MLRLTLTAAIAAVSLAIPHVTSSTSGTPVVAAIRGDIYVFSANKSPRRLTNKGTDSNPVVAPGGALAAFIRTPRSEAKIRVSGPQRRLVMLAELPSSPVGPMTVTQMAEETSPPSQLGITFGRCQCAPEAFFFNHGSIGWRRMTGNQSRGGRPLGLPGNTSRYSQIAVSPLDFVVATAFNAPISASGYPRTLKILVNSRVIVATLRPGVLGSQLPVKGGSYPVGDGLTFTRDGHHLLFATARTGEGYEITGIFSVSDKGGQAYMVLGTGNGVHGHPPFGPGLGGATQFQMSPNGRYLATDPNNNFWVSGSATRPTTVAVPRGKSCVLAQWSWLSDSSGFAYVTACSSATRIRLTLAMVKRTGGAPRVLYITTSTNQDAIDLAPAYRCIACGG
jgi:hypothetical protein